MKKKFLFFTMIFVMLFQLSFPDFYVHAASSPSTSSPEVCATPSPQMILYQKFQEEMANKLLGGDFGETIFKNDWQFVGLFTSKTLKIPQSENQAIDAVLNSMIRGITRLGQATLTTFVLLSLSSASVVASSLEGIPMLFQDRAIVRERRTLLRIETNIIQIAYFIGKTKDIMAPMKDVSELRAIVDKYVEKGLFVKPSDRGFSYFNILSDLARMNAAMKHFIASDSIQVLQASPYPFLFDVTFHTTGLQQMQTYYKPVRLPKGASPCNATFKKMGSGIKQAFAANTSAAKDAGATITDAFKRLKDAFSKSDGSTPKKQKEKTLAEKNFSEYELQQLRTIYGVDTTRMTSRDVPHRRNLLQVGPMAKQSWSDSKKKQKTLIEETKDIGREIWNISKSVYKGTKMLGWGSWEIAKTTFKGVSNFVSRYFRAKTAQEQQEKNLNAWGFNIAAGSVRSEIGLDQNDRSYLFINNMDTLYNKYYDDTLHDAFSASLSDALKLYAETTENFVAADVSTISPRFYALIDQLRQAWDVIGTKDTWIMKNIWTICQKQCTNKGTKGCRPSSS